LESLLDDYPEQRYGGTASPVDACWDQNQVFNLPTGACLVANYDSSTTCTQAWGGLKCSKPDADYEDDTMSSTVAITDTGWYSMNITNLFKYFKRHGATYADCVFKDTTVKYYDNEGMWTYITGTNKAAKYIASREGTSEPILIFYYANQSQTQSRRRNILTRNELIEH